MKESKEVNVYRYLYNIETDKLDVRNFLMEESGKSYKFIRDVEDPDFYPVWKTRSKDEIHQITSHSHSGNIRIAFVSYRLNDAPEFRTLFKLKCLNLAQMDISKIQENIRKISDLISKAIDNEETL